MDVPPLQRDALERLPEAVAQLKSFWQMMAQAAVLAEETLADFDPDHLPAWAFGLWVQAHRAHLRQTWTTAMTVYTVVGHLQVLPEYLVHVLVEYYEDEVATTD